MIKGRTLRAHRLPFTTLILVTLLLSNLLVSTRTFAQSPGDGLDTDPTNNKATTSKSRGNALAYRFSPPPNGCAQTLFTSETFVSATGIGANSADVSIIAPIHNGNGIRADGTTRTVAEDFTATSTWTPSNLTFYGYQLDPAPAPSPTSPLTSVTLTLWDGDPSSGGNIIQGPVVGTNFSTGWTNTYRVSPSNLTDASRPIMFVGVNWPASFPGTLTPGTYWIEWSFTGNFAAAPAVPFAAVNTSDNALTNSGGWSQIDGNSNTPTIIEPVGLPFKICGSASSTPTITMAGVRTTGCASGQSQLTTTVAGLTPGITYTLDTRVSNGANSFYSSARYGVTFNVASGTLYQRLADRNDANLSPKLPYPLPAGTPVSVIMSILDTSGTTLLAQTTVSYTCDTGAFSAPNPLSGQKFNPYPNK